MAPLNPAADLPEELREDWSDEERPLLGLLGDQVNVHLQDGGDLIQATLVDGLVGQGLDEVC